MKYPIEQFENFKAYLKVIAKHYNLDKETAIKNLYHLHYIVFKQVNYTDDNANVIFVNGERLLSLNENFKLYPDGCNDTHIETATKKAINEIF
jgi:hypothetical protein